MRARRLAAGVTASAVLAVFGAGVPVAQETRPEYEGLTCYFGVLHAHTVLSPDFRPQVDRAQLQQLLATSDEERFSIPNGPVAAWAEAFDEAKLDFLALSDHLHGTDSAHEPCRDEMPPGGYRLLVEAAQRINTAAGNDGRRLAIPAVEWNHLSKGNHTNILFAQNAVPNSIPNGAFLRLRDEYLEAEGQERGNPLLLLQMNHPDRPTKDFGRGLYPLGAEGDAQYYEALGHWFKGVEHINNSDLENANDRETNAHRDGSETLEEHYQTLLNMGMRVAPVGDHDNHRPNWGRHTAARTGVWAERMTPTKFVEAYKARRVFATEDSEMAVLFMAEGQWMGSKILLPAGGRDVTFVARVQQMEDTTDGSVHNEGPYTIQLWGDEDGVGGGKAKQLPFKIGNRTVTQANLRQDRLLRMRRTVRPNSYYYLIVREQHGDDCLTVDTQITAMDDAWTAPIWFGQQ